MQTFLTNFFYYFIIKFSNISPQGKNSGFHWIYVDSRIV